MKSMSFGQNLSRILARRRLRLSRVSEATGIPLSTLSEWTGGREPKLSDALVRLANYLGVTLDELARAEGQSAAERRTAGEGRVHIGGVSYRLVVELESVE